MLSGVKRGSYDIASFNALLSASPWPHSLAWLKEVHGAELESDRKVCCFTGNGMVYIYIWHYVEARYIQFTYRSTFRIPHSKSVSSFVYYEVKWCWNLLFHKPTCIAPKALCWFQLVSSQTNLHCKVQRSWGKSHILTPFGPSSGEAMALRAQHCKLQWYHRDHETGTGMETWTARWVRLGCLGCFDVEDLQPQFFSVDTSTRKAMLKGKLCWFSITSPLHIAEIR